jgi:hypothetical protein
MNLSLLSSGSKNNPRKNPSHLLHAGFFALFLDPEGGGDIFLCKAG